MKLLIALVVLLPVGVWGQGPGIGAQGGPNIGGGLSAANFMPALTASGTTNSSSFTNGSVLLVDPVNGNDSTAVRNNGQKAWKLLATAISASTNGETIILTNGTHLLTNNAVLKSGQSLIGGSANTVTILYYPDSAAPSGIIIKPANNTLVSGITIKHALWNWTTAQFSADPTYNDPGFGTDAPFCVSAADPAANNFTLQGVIMYGAIDGVLINCTAVCSGTLRNVTIYSQEDSIVTQGANHLINGYNVDIYSMGPSATTGGSTGRGVLATLGTVNLFGGHIGSYSLDVGASSIIALASGGSITLTGMRFNANTPNPYQGNVKIKNCILEISTGYDVRTGTFSGNGGLLTNLPPPVLVSTNWVSGKVNTNLSGRIQWVQTSVSCTAASIAGGAVVRLQSGTTQAGLATIAQFGMQTISGSLVVTNTGTVGGYITSGNVFSFTNLVGGAGDSAINLPGTGQQVTY